MKKLITTIAVALVVSAFSAKAEDIKNPEAASRRLAVGAYQIGNSLKINMFIEKKMGEKATVKLVDANRNVLYEEVVGKKDASFKFTFDLSELPVGTYFIETTAHGETITKEILRSEKTLSY